MIKFQAKYLPLIFPFLPEYEDIRYYLNGIRIEPAEGGGAYLVATTGHILVVIHDSGAICDEAAIVSVRKDALRFCRRTKTLQSSHAITTNVVIDQNRLTIFADETELYLQPGKCLIEIREKDPKWPGHVGYPDWRHSLPDFSTLKQGSPASMNSRHVASIGTVVSKTHPSDVMTPMRFWSQGDEHSAIVVQFETSPEMLAIMMPVRGYDNIKTFSPAIRAAMKKEGVAV